MNWIFVFESEGGGTEFHPIKTKCVNINFKKFFWEKLNTKSIVWLSVLKPQGNSLWKKKKKKIANKQKQNWEFTFWSDDRYLDVQNINMKNHKSGLIIYSDLKSKVESHDIIKLLSIIIPIFIQQVKFQPQ